MSKAAVASKESMVTTRAPEPSSARLKQITLSFLRLGTTAFGGPAAHIAMMDEEFVRRRGWISHAEFLDMLGASNLVPGPSSTEMAIHIGHQRAGWKGLVLAGVSFIVPAMLMVMSFAWAYVRFRSLPAIQTGLYGVKPVIIAVILQAVWGLGRAALKDGFLRMVGLAATIAALGGINVLVVLLAAGLMAMARVAVRESRLSGHQAASLVALLPAGAALSAAMPISLWGLFLVFLKFGAVIFGSGYVLLAFLQADLVNRLHWLTQSQLLDAVAVGQVTPGPVFTTATFIGYLLGGIPGALVATVGIFVPGFLFVAASRPLIPRIRNSRTTGAFLDGVNVGAVALMTAVTWQLGRAAVVDIPTAAIGALSAIALIALRLNSVWLLGAGAVLGFAAQHWLGA